MHAHKKNKLHNYTISFALDFKFTYVPVFIQKRLDMRFFMYFKS